MIWFIVPIITVFLALLIALVMWQYILAFIFMWCVVAGAFYAINALGEKIEKRNK